MKQKKILKNIKKNKKLFNPPSKKKKKNLAFIN